MTHRIERDVDMPGHECRHAAAARVSSPMCCIYVGGRRVHTAQLILHVYHYGMLIVLDIVFAIITVSSQFVW